MPPGATGGYGDDAAAAAGAALAAFIADNEIDPSTAADLATVRTFQRVLFLLDDSGSMRTKVLPPGVNQWSPQYAACLTRWQELQNDVATMLGAVLAVKPAGGVDVYFLNRPGLYDVTSMAQLAPAFVAPPQGHTPINSVLAQIFARCRDCYPSGNCLVVAITDGEPSPEDGGTDGLFRVLSSGRPRNVFVTIAECNDNVRMRRCAGHSCRAVTAPWPRECL
jgi:hypothetical protein